MGDYNTANPKDIRKAEKAAKVADRQSGEVIINLMSTVHGRQWVWTELGHCHLFCTSFSSDIAQMAFAEGERNCGLRLFSQIMNHCPEQFTQAMREANERTNTNTIRDPNAEPDTAISDYGDEAVTE